MVSLAQPPTPPKDPTKNTNHLGRALLTRVQGSDGRQHAEITLTVALAPAETVARRQLSGLIADLRTVITRAYRRSIA